MTEKSNGRRSAVYASLQRLGNHYAFAGTCTRGFDQRLRETLRFRYGLNQGLDVLLLVFGLVFSQVQAFFDDEHAA